MSVCMGLMVSAFAGMTSAAETNALEEISPDSLPELWFPVGEELVYRIKWGLISVGRSRIASEWILRDGKVLLAIRYRTRTNRVFNKIYPMNDSAEAIVDPATFLPVSFSFRKKRWRTACDDVVTFDYDRGVAHIESRCEGSVKDVAINREVRDIISFMYWMRRTPLAAGLDEPFRVMINDGIAELRIRTADKPELLNLPGFGKIECLRLEPEADLGGLLVEKGEVTLWVAKDVRQLAPRLAVDAPLAKVRTTLLRVTGPGDDKWTAVTRQKEGGQDSSVTDEGDGKDNSEATEE